MSPSQNSGFGARKPFHEECGFSIVSMLVALGLISIITYFVSQAFITSKRAKQSLKASENYQQVEAIIKDTLKTFVKSSITQAGVPCASLNTAFGSHAFLRPNATNRTKASTAVPEGITNAAWSEFLQGSFSAKSLGGAALDRCPQTVLGDGGRFHFCLKVQRDTNANKGSIFEAPLSYSEVSIQLLDLQSGKKISCSDYMSPNLRSAGASVDYLLFWVVENGPRLELKHSTGTFYVNK